MSDQSKSAKLITLIQESSVQTFFSLRNLREPLRILQGRAARTEFHGPETKYSDQTLRNKSAVPSKETGTFFCLLLVLLLKPRT